MCRGVLSILVQAKLERPSRYQWIRRSGETASVTSELGQMREEVRTLRWLVAGLIILLSFLCLWLIRMRSQNNGGTAFTTGTPTKRLVSVPAVPPPP